MAAVRAPTMAAMIHQCRTKGREAARRQYGAGKRKRRSAKNRMGKTLWSPGKAAVKIKSEVREGLESTAARGAIFFRIPKTLSFLLTIHEEKRPDMRAFPPG